MKHLAVPAALLALALAAPAGAEDTGTVTGRITSKGKPVPFAVVIADYQHADLAARADAMGRYKIAGVPTGNHDVFSFAEGGYIYDHGGFPKIDAGTNDHSRNLFHLTDTTPAPTVTNVKWAATSGAPGATLDVSADWKAHDGSGVSDEIFVYVPQFDHPVRFGVGKTRVGKNPDGNYTAHLAIPADAKPGTYTAYIFGASESCYTTVKWPRQTITVK
jgi:hypothetical protein